MIPRYFALITLLLFSFRCDVDARSKKRAIAQKPAHTVGVPEFKLKSGQEFSAGRIFAVKLKNGKTVYITPLHLIGPSGGLDTQLTTAECHKQLDRVDIYDLNRKTKIGSGKGQLLKTGDPKKCETNDFRDDLLAFATVGNSCLKPIAMNEDLPGKGTKVYLIGRESGEKSSKATNFEATVTRSNEKHIAIHLTKPLKLGALSGSPVLNAKDKLVGMVYGGLDAQQIFFLNPGASICKRLNKEL